MKNNVKQSLHKTKSYLCLLRRIVDHQLEATFVASIVHGAQSTAGWLHDRHQELNELEKKAKGWL